MYSFWAMYSFRMSFWRVPPNWANDTPCFSATGQVHGPDYGRRAVDGHGGGDLVQGQTLKKGFHVGQRRYRHSASPEFSLGLDVVGVVAVQGGHVEGHAKTGLPAVQEELESGVGFLGQAKTGEHAHGPQPFPVTCGVDAPQIRVLSRQTHVIQVVGFRQVFRSINRFHRDLGWCFVAGPAQGTGGNLLPPLGAPFPESLQFIWGKQA